jgi:hypothetical protein
LGKGEVRLRLVLRRPTELLSRYFLSKVFAVAGGAKRSLVKDWENATNASFQSYRFLLFRDQSGFDFGHQRLGAGIASSDG